MTRRRSDSDEGFSLTEILVSMGIMSVVFAVVGTAVIQTYSSFNKIDNISVARDQLASSFRRLDTEIRYAEWIATPAQVNGRWYLEYELPPNPKLANGPQRCRQLVFVPPSGGQKDGKLTLAAWDLPNGLPGAATVLASHLTLSGTTQPFTKYAVGATPYASAGTDTAGVGKAYKIEHAQVRFRFLASEGRVTLPQDIVFTAQNTDESNKEATSDCSKGRP